MNKIIVCTYLFIIVVLNYVEFEFIQFLLPSSTLVSPHCIHFVFYLKIVRRAVVRHALPGLHWS